jgi:hypothetical protein
MCRHGDVQIGGLGKIEELVQEVVWKFNIIVYKNHPIELLEIEASQTLVEVLELAFSFRTWHCSGCHMVPRARHPLKYGKQFFLPFRDLYSGDEHCAGREGLHRPTKSRPLQRQPCIEQRVFQAAFRAPLTMECSAIGAIEICRTRYLIRQASILLMEFVPEILPLSGIRFDATRGLEVVRVSSSEPF